jgi:hypothetical protein
MAKLVPVEVYPVIASGEFPSPPAPAPARQAAVPAQVRGRGIVPLRGSMMISSL